MDFIRRFGVASGLVLIVLGLICYIFRSQVVAFLGVAVGIVIFLAGAYFLIGYLMMKRESDKSVIRLLCGILLVIYGIYLMINTGLMIRVVGVFIGVMAFIAGANRFFTASARKSSGLSGNKNVLFGIIHVLFGIVMCIAPTWGVDVLVMLAGFYLIISGIMVLISVLKYHDL